MAKLLLKNHKGVFSMKKKYEDLYMKLCNFVEQDILTESGESGEELHDNWYDETQAPSWW